MHPGPLLPKNFPDPTLSAKAFDREMVHAGFVLLVHQRGIPLEKNLQHLAWRLSEEERAQGAQHPGRRVFSGVQSPSREVSQWWWHPAGVLCHCEKTEGERTHTVTAIACENKGYAQETTTAFSKAGETLLIHKIAGSQARKGWTQLIGLEDRGRLLPVSLWPSGKVLPVSLQFLPIPSPSPVLDDILNPNQIGLQVRQHAVNSLEEVLRPWVAALAHLPEGERAWLKEEIRSQMGDVFHFHLQGVSLPDSQNKTRSLGFSIPLLAERRREYRKELLHNNASRLIQERFLAKDAPLPDGDRESIQMWLDMLKDPRSPRVLEKELTQAFASGPRASSWRFHDLLLALPAEQGSLRKLAWWIDREHPKVLHDLSSRPDPGGMTLPMRLLAAWIGVENERVDPRKQRLRIEYAKGCLETLAAKVPVSSWVLETDSASPWDRFFQSTIFFPADTDLVQAHQQALGDLLDWSDAARIELPGNLNVPGHGRIHLTNPDLEDALAKAVQKGDVEDRGPMSSRLHGYFGALMSALSARHMADRLDQAPTTRLGPSRARF